MHDSRTSDDLLLREFRLNGFVVLRNFLPVDYVESVREQLRPILSGEYKRISAEGWKEGRSRGRIALHLEQFVKLLGGPMADSRYVANPTVEGLVDRVMGEGQWARGWTLVETVWKEAGFMAWHSDQKVSDTPEPSKPNETIRMTFNVPLVDFTWSSGSMEIIPGSHLQPRAFLDSPEIAHVRNIYPVRLDLSVGDAILRDGNTLHRGTPNLHDEPRPMLDQTYKKALG